MDEPSSAPGSAEDSDSVELLRLWLSGDELQCALRPDLFDDPGSWGAVLADVVRHVARVRREREGVPDAETMRRVLDVLGEELRGDPA